MLVLLLSLIIIIEYHNDADFDIKKINGLVPAI